MASDSVSRSDPRVVLVAAVAANGVIGQDGAMPWHYPEDLQHFRETTMGAPVIMGRVTYESIREQLGGPLDGRTNIVLSTTLTTAPDAGVEVCPSIADALETATRTESESVYVIGGARVYEQFLPLADSMILTEIHEQYEGDTYFPDWDATTWTEVERVEHETLSFVTYERA